MPSTSGNRLRMVVVIMLAIPLCIGWCVLALQQMLETLTSQVASFPTEREVIDDVQLAQRQADTQGWLGDVVLRKAGDAIGSIGTPDGQQTANVNFVVAAVAADDFYTLQTVLTVVLVFSVIGVAILATAIRRLSSERIHVVTPAVGAEVGGEAAKFDAEPMDVRDLMTAMHTLGSEMRRQVSEVSHEMRTPLAIIAGSLASIQRTLPQDHQKANRAAALIGESCDRLVGILDSHRAGTSRLVDSFLGFHNSIDIGAFLQDFIVHAGMGSAVSLTHPPQPLIVWTQADGLKEVMKLFLVASPQRCEGLTARLSLSEKRSWIEIVICYDRTGSDRTALSVLPAVEWALDECRRHLSMMGATLKTAVQPDGQVSVHLFLPIDDAT
jgi:hypothetical protein